jgi:dinuclear metal center YbgI/SA1388 family protein
MVKIGDIRDLLFSAAPRELAMDFDNVGLLVGREDAEVTAILLSLDITSEVIAEAEDAGVQLIVSHHPVIWDAMKSLTGSTVQERKVSKLIKSNIAAICMHTNMDIAEGGVNDALMSRLGGKTSGILEPTGNGSGCGRVGELEKALTVHEFLSVCKTSLNAGGLRYHDSGRKVKKLAVMGGAGGDCVQLAYDMGCDTYVTADIKYDQFLLARELGINLIDADHFCTENVIVPRLEELINSAFPEVRTVISSRHSQTAKFF